MVTNVIERNTLRGYEKLVGTEGDDTYLINDLSTTWTLIEDNGNSDCDSLVINNTLPNDVMLFFDVALDDVEDNRISDQLCILRKDKLNSVMTSIVNNKVPTAGGIEVNYYFGTTNNITANKEVVGTDYMQTITLVDKNGVEKILNVNDTISIVQDEIKEFLSATQYGTAVEYLFGNTTKAEKEELLNIYKNARLITELAPGSIDIEYDSKGNIQLIDLSNCTCLRDFNDGSHGGLMDDGYGWGPYLRTDKKGNNLVIEYNGEWKKGEEDWVDAKRLVIPNYFSKPTDIQVKAYVAEFDGEFGPSMSEEPQIFNLIDIALNCSEFSYSRGNLNGTALADEVDGRYCDEEEIVLNVINGQGGNDIIIGGISDQKIYGGTGKNLLFFKQGDGNDTIYSTKGAEDTLVFEDLENADNMSFEAKGYNLVINYGENSTITIVDYLRNPSDSSVKYVQFGHADRVTLAEVLALKPSEIIGDDGANILKGGLLSDKITGGKGDDKLYGGKSVNTFVFNVGDGHDTIYYEGGTDIIDLTGISSSSLNLDLGIDGRTVFDGTRQGNDLIIQYTHGTNPDTIRLANYFKTGQKSDIQIQFKDENGEIVKDDIKNLVTMDLVYEDSRRGQSITGTFLEDWIDGSDYADTIRGGDGDDNIYGGKGNDRLYGDAGKNIFEFSKGDGNDIIYSDKNAQDKIILTDVNQNDVVLTRTGNNLVLQYTESDSITIANYYAKNSICSVKSIQFVDGEVNLDTFVENFVNYMGETNLEYANKNNYSRAINAQNIIGSRLDDSIIGSRYDDTIKGGRGHDIIKGGAGDDIIIGGTGNDKLYGEAGKNTFKFSVGDGNDTIYTTKGAEDTLVFEDLENADNMSFEAKGYNLVINYGENSTITIVDYLRNPSDSSVKYVQFGHADRVTLAEVLALKPSEIIGDDGANILKGGLLSDKITGGKGDDKLYGGKSVNTFVFNVGDGHDTIYYEGGTDIIDLTGISSSSLNLDLGIDGRTVFDGTRQGNDLIIQYTHGTNPDTIRLANYFKTGQKSDIQIQFKDENGEIVKDDIKNLVTMDLVYEDSRRGQSITGTFLEDWIDGSDYADTIRGGDGDDNIYGGKGNDRLYGDAGKNIFEFSKGDGNDIIYSDKNAQDKIILTDVNQNDVVLTRTGNNLVLQYTESDSITIANYYAKNSICSVKSIQFVDGEVNLDTFVENFVNYMGETNLEYANKNNYSRAINAQNIIGSRLDDSIIGSRYDDTIKGGRGHDIIKGGAGDDIIIGGTGNDKLYGEAGKNTFKFSVGDGNDIIYMGTGDDTLNIQNANIEDLHYEKSGNHLIVKYGEDDSITVNNYFITKNKSVDEIIATNGTVSLDNDIVISKSSEFDTVHIETDDGVINIPADCYIGNNYNNLVVANNNRKLNFVETDDGDDVIYCQAKQIIAKGGDGDDTYVISSLNNATEIEDEGGGKDILQIADKSSNVNIIFNVKANPDKNINETSMMILNRANLNRLISTRNIETITGGIDIFDYFSEDGAFGSGAVERIETKDGYVTLSQIDEVKSEVASWLTENNFASSVDVLSDGNKNQINELLAIYQNIDWQV